jgi:ketosteroid isomerase-like protein
MAEASRAHEAPEEGMSASATLFTCWLIAFAAPAWAGAAADIKALEDRLVAAIMKPYAPGQTLVVFDVVPSRQYVGAAAYRKAWQTFLGTFDGPITVELADLGVVPDRNHAYGHSIQHIAGNDKQDKKLDLTVRVTEVYQKIRAPGKSSMSTSHCRSTLLPMSPISAPSRSSSH